MSRESRRAQQQRPTVTIEDTTPDTGVAALPLGTGLTPQGLCVRQQARAVSSVTESIHERNGTQSAAATG